MQLSGGGISWVVSDGMEQSCPDIVYTTYTILLVFLRVNLREVGC